MKNWTKGFIRALYAIPIFAVRLALSLVFIPIGAIFMLGDWAHNEKFLVKDWTDGIKELWNVGYKVKKS